MKETDFILTDRIDSLQRIADFFTITNVQEYYPGRGSDMYEEEFIEFTESFEKPMKWSDQIMGVDPRKNQNIWHNRCSYCNVVIMSENKVWNHEAA